jgi:hypothetical protein
LRAFDHCEGSSSNRRPVEFVQGVELIDGKNITMSTPKGTEQTVCFESDDDNINYCNAYLISVSLVKF